MLSSLKWTFVVLALTVSAACVTINIYFPAAAAEKAADRIIDEVWQLRSGAATGNGGAASGGEAASEGAKP